MENNLYGSWLNTNFFFNDNNIFRSYNNLIKNMIELNDLSKQINLISIKTKIINKICYFYIKYLEQTNLIMMV